MSLEVAITMVRGIHRRHIATAVALLAVIGVAVAVWEVHLADRVVPKRWGAIEPGQLYRSGQLSSALVDRTLERHGIRTIINLTEDDPGDPDHQAETRAAERLGINVLRFPLVGNGTGDISHYADAIEAMIAARDEGRPALVHCAAGVQRTGGVIACYRMLVEGVHPADARREMRRYGWRPRRDMALAHYVNANIHVLAEMLVERGVIAGVTSPLPLLPVDDLPTWAPPLGAGETR